MLATMVKRDKEGVCSDDLSNGLMALPPVTSTLIMSVVYSGQNVKFVSTKLLDFCINTEFLVPQTILKKLFRIVLYAAD